MMDAGMTPYDELLRENQRLQDRLEEAHEILTAIRTGAVDAVVVDGPAGEQIYTLEGADHPYRIFVETMNEGAVTLTATGTIVYCNQRAGDLLGMPLDQILGKGFADFVGSAGRAEFEAMLAQADEAGSRGEFLLDQPCCEPIPVRVSARRLPEECGKSLCLVITDLRGQKLRDALQQSQEELRAFAGQLEQRVEERTQDLVASRQHLRALTAELNRTEQRLCNRLARELHDYLAQLLVLGRLKIGSARSQWDGTEPSMVNFIGELDDIFAKSIAYTRTLMADLSPPVLQLGLPAALKWLSEQMVKHKLNVTFHAAQEQVPLPDDHVMLLYQSVRELLMNVIKHAHTPHATLSIAVDRGDLLKISVRDEGKGFNPRTLDLQPASEHFGILSVRERMEALGGRCQTDSAPGRGTEVTLTVPLQTTVAVARGDTARALSREPLALVEKNGPVHRVVLVEDHAMIRQGLRAILDGFQDVLVIGEATNGEEAVSIVSDVRPDIVLMDVNMPKMDGIEATRRIVTTFPSAVIIGLSVNDSPPLIEAMKKAGAAAFVAKEAAAEQLHDAIVRFAPVMARSPHVPS
ncbi:response regulator [Nitrospira sp. Nam80]